MTMTTTTTVLSTVASLAASVMLVRSIANDLLPHHCQGYIFSSITKLFTYYSSQLIVIIQEYEGLSTNQIYKAAETYLGTKVSNSAKKLRASKQDKENSIMITMDQGEEVVDVFQGIQFRWRLRCRNANRPEIHRWQHHDSMDASAPFESKSFKLSFHKKHRDVALSSYLPYIIDQCEAIRNEVRTRKLYTNKRSSWNSVNLRHPATFETLAMDPELKRALVDDLSRFIRRKEYYKRIGKAWKRGYLLYGPPGTGKSSLIAAMANFLKFDIYDLELTEVRSNSNLRSLLIGTANQSILVVEDIDCSVELQQRESEGGSKNKQSPNDDGKVTLSGVLNFVDGLWSSCGDERIIVFTTNYRERLEPALLRPGRMDVHIHMTYLCPPAFRVLAANYHAVGDHPLFAKIDGLLSKVEATPAEVAEALLKSDEVEIALQGLVEFLQMKSKNAHEAEVVRSVEHQDLGEEAAN